MKALLSKYLPHILTGLGILLAAGIAITVDDTGSGPTHKHTVTIVLGGPGHKVVPLPPPAQQVAQTQATQDANGQPQLAHSDLKAESPAASTPQVLQHDQNLTPAGQPTIPANPPLATVHQPGCRTLPVRNYSSRQGSPVLLGVLHQTISPDDGWNGVLGNVKWFDSLAAQASSNYIVARTGGQCAYIVPESQKAWAQAGFNRVALSIEVTERGTEPTYLPPGSAGEKRVLQLMVAWHKRWGIPYRHGAVSGCSVVRTGFVEHADLGVCGGGHHDDFPPCNSACFDKLIAKAAAQDAASTALGRAKRSHRIVHAKLKANCRHAAERRGPVCQRLLRENAALHKRWGAKLTG